MEAETAARAAPGDVGLQLLAARLQREDLNERRRFLETALRADPHSVGARVALADHEQDRGHPERALALLEPGVPVIALATQSATYDKMVSNVQEVLARHAWVVAITRPGDQRLRSLAGEENLITIPEAHDAINPVLVAVVVQLLAYYAALKLERDIDQPRNLAKSVTVE